MILFNSFLSIFLLMNSFSILFALIMNGVTALAFFEKIIIDSRLIDYLKGINKSIEISVHHIMIDGIEISVKNVFPLQNREFQYLKDLLIFRYPKAKLISEDYMGDIKFEIFKLKVLE